MAENDQIDQLWYTWATIGLDSISAGFRVRAASYGLRDIMSTRFQHLDQYLRYRLPNGSDRFNPTYAPPTLALLHANTGERTERILVNKYYTGRDKVGRPGAFFAHLLAPLPHDFTTRDAFLLWHSPLWRSSDEYNEYNESMDNSIELRPTSLQQLRAQWEYPLDQLDIFQSYGVDSEQLRMFLPNCIAAYLLWRTEWEAQQGKPSKHLYLVADAYMVGAFLLALALCLPNDLLNGITFSTYEKDVQAAGQTMLVGITFSNEMAGNREDIPASCYVQDIVVNSYYNKNTPLESYSRIIDIDRNTGAELSLAQIATVVAKDITARLVPSKKGTLKNFLRDVEKPKRQITVELYLRAYKKRFLDPRRKKDQNSFKEIENNPAEAGMDLVEPGAISDYLDEASRDPQWGSGVFLRGLQRFVDYRDQDEELAGALYDIGLGAEERFVEAVEHEQATQFGPLMIDMMKKVALLQQSNTLSQQLNALFFAQAQKIWNAPVYYLRDHSASTPLFLDFFLTNPSYYFSFLTRWTYTLREDEYYLLNNVLRVPWQKSEDFFGLKIPREWIDTAFAASPIPPEIVRAPGQLLLKRVKAEMLRCLQAGQWQQAINIYNYFEAAPLSIRQDLLTVLLANPLSFRQEQQFITDENRLWFLQRYGQYYLKQYLQEKDWSEAVNFYNRFAVTPWSQRQDLLAVLLDNPLGFRYEQQFITDETRLWFLQNYGQSYLNRYLQARDWLGAVNFYNNFATVPWSYRQDLLAMLLDSPLSMGQEQPFIIDENRTWFLQRYGRSSLQRYLQAGNWTGAVNFYKNTEWAPLPLRQNLLVVLLESPLSVGHEHELIDDGNRLWVLKNYGTFCMKRYLQASNWLGAVNFYNSFATIVWPYQEGLLRVLLESPLSRGQEQQFIKEENRLWFLQNYGESYLKHYLEVRQWQQAITFYNNFAMVPWSNRVSLVSLLLDSSLSTGYEHLFIDDENRLWFLQLYGPIYLPRQREQSIREQFSYYVSNEPKNKLTVLHTWLGPLVPNQDVHIREFVAWRESQSGQNMETIVDIAQLQGKEIFYFLETYGQYYLSKYDASYRSMKQTHMNELLKAYLAPLDEFRLQSAPPQTQHFVSFLRQIANDLPKDIREKISELFLLGDVFQYRTDCQKLVVELARLLETHPKYPDYRQGLYEKLAPVFVDTIPNETYLVNVIDTMREIPYYTLYDLFQVLLKVGEELRNRMAKQSLQINTLVDTLAIYLNFVLFAHVLFVRANSSSRKVRPSMIEYQYFQKQFLDILLLGMHPNILKELQQKLSGESKKMLNAYLDNQPMRLHDDQQQLADSADDVTPPVVTKESIVGKIFQEAKNDVELIEKLRPHVQQQTFRYVLRPQLVSRFVTTISNETYLAEVIRTMAKMTEEMNPSFTLDDLYSILLQMAEFVRDRMASKSPPEYLIERVVLYVKFLSHARVIMEVNEYFRLSFLDRLLDGLDTDMLNRVEQQLIGNDKKPMKWYREMRPRKSTKSPYSNNRVSSSSAKNNGNERVPVGSGASNAASGSMGRSMERPALPREQDPVGLQLPLSDKERQQSNQVNFSEAYKLEQQQKRKKWFGLF